MVRHQAALVSGRLTRVTLGVNLPPSEVIMSRLLEAAKKRPEGVLYGLEPSLPSRRRAIPQTAA
jgi:hypothetical protein